jgi:hypothetical protein
MKKVIVMALALCFASLAISTYAGNNVTLSKSTGEPKWEKSKEGTWLGADKTWYKLNTKDASVWWSKDGKKWEAVKDGMWQDKDGKWLKIGDKKLWWSKDGKEWAEVPEWKWEGHNSVWNKFDKDWTLWTAKA